ncbi:MAG TPA: endolytic transglycosylase MltG, partial [Alphaproteobacteria bacterium]|nr:endolytic transglycosylase MltG [Alphaproteobacteria bacterium]
MRAFARIFTGLTALVALAAGALFFIVYRFEAPGPLQDETTVQIPRGSGLNAIADRLEEAGIVEDRWIFIAGVMLERRERSLQAGEYAFAPGISAEEAMEKLSRGDTISYTVTIPEGRTSAEIVAILQAEDLLTGEIASVPPEGSLLPETYHFVRGDSRQSVLDRMTAAMDGAIAEVWANRADDLPIETPEEAVVLASIIEKETGIAGERAMVASVMVNRLKRGMPLQSDPTVIYALTEGTAPLGRELLRSDWDVESPYNTYQVTGLPPGPIANPGRASLEAAVNPAETTYF